MITKLTRDTVQSYIRCKQKGYLRLLGEHGQQSEYGLLLAETRCEIKHRMLTRLCNRHDARVNLNSGLLNRHVLQQGIHFLGNSVIEDDIFSLHVDALSRVHGNSELGDFHYVPLLCSEDERLRKDSKLLLQVFSLALAPLQGCQPDIGTIIHGENCKATTVHFTHHSREKAQSLVDELIAIHTGTPPGPLLLSDHCTVCEFRQRCRSQAIKEEDLSLLGMGKTEKGSYHDKGIFTVTQLSYTFRPRRKTKRAKDQTRPHSYPLQSLAIRNQKTYLHNLPALPMGPVHIYLDVEGDPERTFVYLLGVLVVDAGIGTQYSFWADEQSDEGKVVTELLRLLANYRDYHLYHYGSYDLAFLRRIRKRLRIKSPLDAVLANCVNVLSLIHAHVYFPTYSNGLKDIGQHLGCSWSDPSASGLQSIVWRRRWEQTHDEAMKQRLITYNAEDCSALRTVTEHISALSATCDHPSDDRVDTEDTPSNVVQVTDAKQSTSFHKWGPTEFRLAEFEQITKCAYFDYQRERILARNHPATRRRTNGRKRGKPPRQPRPNKRIEIRATKCPFCKDRNLKRLRKMHTKVKLDLKVQKGGVKRWIIQNRAVRYQCLTCNRTFLPPLYKRKGKYSHTLKSWAIYQHVVNRITFENLEAIFQECFGLTIGGADFGRFKDELASYYRSTYKSILKRLLAGKVLHLDETGMRLKKERGYVWVVASLDDVVYMFRKSREGTFLHKMLRGFHGVLVSDFYKAYDSLPCAQQKCLVHLTRDLNNDLLENGFDEEYKSLAQAFGKLLSNIVTTIDRHGLTRHYFDKHRQEASGFFQDHCDHPYSSRIAEKYRKRFVKCKDKLFTFLEYDGVPWNNNAAEHAIKRFAKYRMITNGRMSENGIKSYLVLLSIYQTCVYRGVSFLQFLLSGERDMDRFCEMQGKRRRVRAMVLERDATAVGRVNPEKDGQDSAVVEK